MGGVHENCSSRGDILCAVGACGVCFTGSSCARLRREYRAEGDRQADSDRRGHVDERHRQLQGSRRRRSRPISNASTTMAAFTAGRSPITTKTIRASSTSPRRPPRSWSSDEGVYVMIGTTSFIECIPNANYYLKAKRARDRARHSVAMLPVEEHRRGQCRSAAKRHRRRRLCAARIGRQDAWSARFRNSPAPTIAATDSRNGARSTASR